MLLQRPILGILEYPIPPSSAQKIRIFLWTQRRWSSTGFSAIWIVCFNSGWWRCVMMSRFDAQIQIRIIANTRNYMALRRKYTNTNMQIHFWKLLMFLKSIYIIAPPPIAQEYYSNTASCKPWEGHISHIGLLEADEDKILVAQVSPKGSTCA